MQIGIGVEKVHRIFGVLEKTYGVELKMQKLNKFNFIHFLNCHDWVIVMHASEQVFSKLNSESKWSPK